MITSYRTGPKTKRLAEERFFRLIYEASLDTDAGVMAVVKGQVPEAWHVLEYDLDVEEPKEKVTLYLDKSVAKTFRAMGKGYHARINRVLATWVQMKIAEMRELELSHLDALREARLQKNGDEIEDMEPRRAKELHEHWAYLQGLLDGQQKKR